MANTEHLIQALDAALIKRAADFGEYASRWGRVWRDNEVLVFVEEDKLIPTRNATPEEIDAVREFVEEQNKLNKPSFDFYSEKPQTGMTASEPVDVPAPEQEAEPEQQQPPAAKKNSSLTRLPEPMQPQLHLSMKNDQVKEYNQTLPAALRLEESSNVDPQLYQTQCFQEGYCVLTALNQLIGATGGMSR